jgi:hypothetical protein
MPKNNNITLIGRVTKYYHEIKYKERETMNTIMTDWKTQGKMVQLQHF